MGFGITTVLLNIHNAGFYPLDSIILAMGIFNEVWHRYGMRCRENHITPGYRRVGSVTSVMDLKNKEIAYNRTDTAQ